MVALAGKFEEAIEPTAEQSTGLTIRSLKLSNFRNYRAFELPNIGSLTIFVGHNAVGKTNLLEAIQLLTSAVSFRHPAIAELVKEGEQTAYVEMEASDGNRNIVTGLGLENGKRRYWVNGKGKGAVDVRGTLPAVAFTPDDLQLAKKSSGVKRTALDDLGSQLSRNYYIVRRDYEKTIRYKNRLLRDEASTPLIESINEMVVTCGAQLHSYRLALFSRMVTQVANYYDDLSLGEEQFAARFRSSWHRVEQDEVSWLNLGCTADKQPTVLPSDAREVLKVELARHLKEERLRKRSLIGPHNDELQFSIDGRDASLFASQGQQRSIILAWKLAEVQTMKETMGVNPVLLLDDVLSELDEQRREMLVSKVTADVQTFMTATDLAGFNQDLISRAQVVRLPLDQFQPEQGRIEVPC